jgi:hypothetical protein
MVVLIQTQNSTNFGNTTHLIDYGQKLHSVRVSFILADPFISAIQSSLFVVAASSNEVPDGRFGHFGFVRNNGEVCVVGGMSALELLNDLWCWQSATGWTPYAALFRSRTMIEMPPLLVQQTELVFCCGLIFALP